MRKLTAILLFLLMVVSVAVMWVTAKWGTSIPETGAFSLAAIWAVLFLLRKQTPRFSFLMLPLGCILLWAGFQLLIGATVYRERTWLAILYWAANLAVFFTAVQIFGDISVRTRFLRWLLVFGFVVSVISALQALTGSTKIYWIFTTEYAGWNLLGPFVYHNQFAAFIELLLPIALYNALTQEKWRAFDIVAAATMYAAVIVAASRAGSALITAELLVVPGIMVWQGRIALKRIPVGIATFAGIILILTLAAGPQLLADKFALKDPYAIRREFVDSSIQMFKARPLLGVGLGNWATAYPKYASFDDGLYANQAHNDWAQWAVEGGAPLLLIMLWIACWAAPKAIRSGWGAGVAAIFLHCFVDYPIQRPAVALIFFALLGAVAAQREDPWIDRENHRAGKRLRVGVAA
jgi:O-antigen ligase